jgi:capsular polysaccharide biosynthesis protein
MDRRTVDFWDLTKLLARRWIIVLPMLVLSGALAVTAMSHVKPDYVATAYVQLVPPTAGGTKPGQATVDQRNPWIGLGLQTIGNAAIVTVTDVSVADQLHASGLSNSYTVTMAQTSPLITFEIVGSSAAQARRTADRLIDHFNMGVANLQTSSGVAEGDSIRTHRIDAGTNIKKSTSKVKRALVAVAGAGLLLTVATTVAIDAWLRRRQRRRAGADRVSAQTPSLRRTPVGAAHSSGDHRPEPHLVTMANAANGNPVNGIGAAVDRDAALARLSADITQPLDQQDPAERADGERRSQRGQPVPSDATVVLPRVWPQPLARSDQGE